MTSRTGKSGQKSEPTKIALWTQIVIVVGGIVVAAITAYQTIKVAKIQAGIEDTDPVPTFTSQHSGVNPGTSMPTETQFVKDTPAPFLTVTSQIPVVNTVTPTPILRLHKINFDYQDSPTQHGWELSEADLVQLEIQHTSDPFVGNAISIRSDIRYRMDYIVGLADAQQGRVLEFAANLTRDAAIFAYVLLAREDGSTQNGWIKMTIREELPEQVDEDEWQISIQPVSSPNGDWMLYRVDLQAAVMQTFGKNGWKFQQLEQLRIRGNLSLGYIYIFET